jgi:protein ImuA
MSSIFQSQHVDLSWQEQSSQPETRDQLIDGLRQQLGRWGATLATEEATVFSCGAAAIDQLLPEGGLRHGMLIEWLSGFGGSGAATLGLLSAREACREGGVLAVIDRSQTFYPPAAAAWGIDLERLIVVRPKTARDELWAVVQALRSPVVAAVWGKFERLESRAFRRLQLAAEAGRTLGVLLRPASARGQPTWAAVRLELSLLSVARSQLYSNHRQRTADQGRLAQVRLVHCRGGRAGGSTTLEIDDVARTVQSGSPYDPHPLRVVTELADSASRSRSARA